MAILYTTLSSAISARVPGNISDAEKRALINSAVRYVLTDIDMRSMKRRSQLSPNLFGSVYDYTSPTTIKGNKLIDVRRQVNRSFGEKWRLVSEADFDRRKESERYVAAFADSDFIRTLKLSGIAGTRQVVVNDATSLTADGTWAVVGGTDATNLTLDTLNYVHGGASLNFDTNTGGTTAAIENSTFTDVDLTDHDEISSIFVWVYVPIVSGTTNFILRWGNDSSNYWSKTVTTANDGNAFVLGWNLLRFDWSSATETGTVDPAAIDYLRLTVTKDAGQAATTNWRMDYVVSRVGDIYDLVYYTKYGWQDTNGTYIENSTADTDEVNVDTDELELIVEKGLEYSLQNMEMWDKAEIHKRNYDELKKVYLKNNPSEAMRMSRNYWE